MNDEDESGTVVSTPSGITCGDDCEETLKEGDSVTLTVQYEDGNGQATWSECDETPNDSCLVELTDDREVMVKLSP